VEAGSREEREKTALAGFRTPGLGFQAEAAGLCRGFCFDLRVNRLEGCRDRIVDTFEPDELEAPARLLGNIVIIATIAGRSITRSKLRFKIAKRQCTRGGKRRVSETHDHMRKVRFSSEPLGIAATSSTVLPYCVLITQRFALPNEKVLHSKMALALALA
jgi:hypothetical protein